MSKKEWKISLQKQSTLQFQVYFANRENLHNIPKGILEILKEIKRKNPVLFNWSDNKILDYFISIILEIPEIFEEKNLDEFHARCREKLIEWEEGVKLPFEISKEQLEVFRKLFDEDDELKDQLKSTEAWKWTTSNQATFDELKKQLVKDWNNGVKCLTNQFNSQLALISDWSKEGIGFTLYEVLCGCTEGWKPDDVNYRFKTQCCQDKWRLIMAGGRYNSAIQSNYGPIEGDLLGIGSGLQRTRYFIASHPKVQVIMGHLPLVNLLSDRSRRRCVCKKAKCNKASSKRLSGKKAMSKG